MDTKINDGGPAFPFPSGPEPRVDEFHERCEGMTLRDYFAAKAIEAMIHMAHNEDGGWDPATVASGCYGLADAMLAARKGE